MKNVLIEKFYEKHGLSGLGALNYENEIMATVRDKNNKTLSVVQIFEIIALYDEKGKIGKYQYNHKKDRFEYIGR